MDMRSLHISAALSAMCLAAACGVAGAQGTTGHSSSANTAGDTAAPADGAGSKSTLSSADRAFMKKAAEGGIAEVETGKLAEKQGEDQKIKSFGSKMVEDHSAANDKLLALAQSKDLKLPTKPGASEQEKMKKLKGLSGAAFDKEYATTMVKDHKEDIKEFEKAAKSAHDPDVKSFAESTLPTLQSHLMLAEALPGAGGSHGTGTAGQ
jgi:putative membrane protein